MVNNFDCIRNSILNSLTECKINAIQVLLIGSLARGDARKTSDADIIICFKNNKVPSDKNIYNLIKSIKSKINRNVDLIVFEYKKKFIKHNECDIDFIENAVIDSRQIINNTNVGKEFLELSKKIGLYKLIN